MQMSNFVIKSIGNILNATSLVAPKYAAKKALQLFATPRKGRYIKNKSVVTDTAVFKTLTHKGLDIATYHWAGKGKTILLVHGWESNASRWGYVLQDLKAQNYNIVALDAPAHGRSGGTQFNAVLYSEFINRVSKEFLPEVLIGHSVGGMASIFCMENHQLTSVKQLISLGAPADLKGVFARYKSMMRYNVKVSNGLDDIVLKHFGKPVSYFSAANFTKTINAKGLIIHDKKDRIIPYKDAQLFNDCYKNAALITTTGFGHSLIDASLTPKIIAFING